MKKQFKIEAQCNDWSLMRKRNYKSVSRLLGVVLILLLLPIQASAARERYVLDFNDSHIRGYRGEAATIYLKKSLRAQYPWVRIAELDLKKVILVAKSKRGHGGAELRVGGWTSDLYNVGGNPRSFHGSNRGSWDRVRFWNPSENSRGPWQINLQGNFKVRKVILVVNEHKKRNYYGRYHRHR